MGGEPYFHYVPYEPDIDAALQQLREREFRAGRYNPVIPFPYLLLPLSPDSPAPGAGHTSIEDAFKDSGPDGTRSILDLDHVSDRPEYCAVTRLDGATLQRLYGTTQPARQMIEQNMDFFDVIEWGQGIDIVISKDGRPDEILFAGYSFD